MASNAAITFLVKLWNVLDLEEFFLSCDTSNTVCMYNEV
ncbi:hypothetical protein BVRB_3g048650 [Beta vulgaris subsp. vulgaris]|nr:hypothetical protein BVRB_3g048650 [Beta vulgaris subsp. vulgaris]